MADVSGLATTAVLNTKIKEVDNKTPAFLKYFFYQSTCNTLVLKKDKNTEYVIGWQSKILFKSKLLSLNVAFLPYIKYNTPSVVEQNQMFHLETLS